MKRAAIIYYTDRGAQTAQTIGQCMASEYECTLYRTRCDVRTLFDEMDALIYVGACGIAVRAIAPCLKSKVTDPAVLVTDERGLNVISLISGHIGGANELTRHIARSIGANPVITTATDVGGRFAVDEWAARQGLKIDSMAAAKAFAMEILKNDVPMETDFPIDGPLPGGVYAGKVSECGVIISCASDQRHSPKTLQLVPKILHMGIGCKRDTPVERIEEAVTLAFENNHLRLDAVKAIASIDVKKDEPGILAFAEKWNLPTDFYSAQALLQVPGTFTASNFVKSTVGVDNVCERSAMLDAGPGASLVVKKTCLNGVTVAVAQEKWSVCFE